MILLSFRDFQYQAWIKENNATLVAALVLIESLWSCMCVSQRTVVLHSRDRFSGLSRRLAALNFSATPRYWGGSLGSIQREETTINRLRNLTPNEVKKWQCTSKHLTPHDFVILPLSQSVYFTCSRRGATLLSDKTTWLAIYVFATDNRIWPSE